MKWNIKYYLKDDDNRIQKARIWKQDIENEEEAKKELLVCYNKQQELSVAWVVSEWGGVSKILRKPEPGLWPFYCI